MHEAGMTEEMLKVVSEKEPPRPGSIRLAELTSSSVKCPM